MATHMPQLTSNENNKGAYFKHHHFHLSMLKPVSVYNMPSLESDLRLP